MHAIAFIYLTKRPVFLLPICCPNAVSVKIINQLAHFVLENDLCRDQKKADNGLCISQKRCVFKMQKQSNIIDKSFIWMTS